MGRIWTMTSFGVKCLDALVCTVDAGVAIHKSRLYIRTFGVVVRVVAMGPGNSIIVS